MRAGDKVLNYTVTRRLKAGGMGVVFEGEQDWGSRRKVAIKQLLENLRDDDVVRRRFIREAEILEMLDYPRIVKILGFDHEQDAFVMEFIDGKTLADVLREDADAFRPPTVLVPFFTSLLDAFAYAHDVTLTINGQTEKGIVHRDIKPSNIIVQPDGGPKILDFGISRVASFQSTLTDPKLQMGSVPYMSPEQIATPTDVDWRSDIYSLGVTLWEMLAGRSPYPRVTTHEVVVEVQRQIRFDPLLSLIQVIPDKKDEEDTFLRRIDQIITKATAKDRAYRYQHCQDMKAALQKALDDYLSEQTQEREPALRPAYDESTQLSRSAPRPVYDESTQLSQLVPPSVIPPSDPITLPPPPTRDDAHRAASENGAVNPAEGSANAKFRQPWILVSAIVLGIAIGGMVWWQRSRKPEPASITVVNPIDSSAGKPTLTIADSAFKMGEKYYAQKEYAQALKWFRASADRGNAECQKYLGYMYWLGQGTSKDYPAAMKWFRASADKGNAESSACVGVLYEQGLGTAVSYADAMKWYSKAANQNYPLAQYYVGTMHETGNGTPQSQTKAVKWYQLAARQGETNAQQALRRLGQAW